MFYVHEARAQLKHFEAQAIMRYPREGFNV